ncbi:MAG: SDR family NAD(P)-dependent oxidoreductase [Alphaproteobacteria bacterium]|nr:SDR family NAD(P)-dependent oxidoreductase [Alphaproteobacteria bacterium]
MSSVALVTGAASGLGLATATRLHAEGFAVVGIDLDADRGQAAFEAFGARGRFVKADVTSEEGVGAAIAAAAELGTLRASVCCAGVGWASRVLSKKGPHPLDLFRKVVEINLVGTFNVHRLAAAAMAEHDADADGQRGVLISTASVAAFEGQIGQVAYSASKGGVAAMTLPIARDLAKLGIRAVTIAPGIFDTPMLATVSDEYRAGLAASVPNPSRLGTPEEYADMAWTIVRTPYLNGTTVRLDGALRMAPK